MSESAKFTIADKESGSKGYWEDNRAGNTSMCGHRAGSVGRSQGAKDS